MPPSAASSEWSAAYWAAMEPPSECPPTHQVFTWGNAERTLSAALMSKNARLNGISTTTARYPRSASSRMSGAYAVYSTFAPG